MTAAVPHCAFCARPRSAVGLMFRSPVGGCGIFICDGCIQGFAELVRVHQSTPEQLDGVVAAHNAEVRTAAAAERYRA